MPAKSIARIGSNDECGAGGGNRTPTRFRAQDFKSRASACFATPAYQLHQLLLIIQLPTFNAVRACYGLFVTLRDPLESAAHTRFIRLIPVPPDKVIESITILFSGIVRERHACWPSNNRMVVHVSVNQCSVGQGGQGCLPVGTLKCSPRRAVAAPPTSESPDIRRADACRRQANLV